MTSSAHFKIPTIDLNGSIAIAASEKRPLVCFVTDDSDASNQWELTLCLRRLNPRLSKDVLVRITAGTQDHEHLNAIAPLTSIPAIVIVHEGQIKHKIQVDETTIEELKSFLESLYGPENEDGSPAASHLEDENTPRVPYVVLPPSTGRMRLPNNAYDAFATQTQKWVDQKIRGSLILVLQTRLLDNIPDLPQKVQMIRSSNDQDVLQLPREVEDKLLNTPASALRMKPATSTNDSANASTSAPRSPPTTSSSSPDTPAQTTRPNDQSSSQQAQRNEYLRLQRERETAQKAEKERIKANIQAQKEERRQQDEIRKQNELANLRQTNSTTAQPRSTDIRLQVRAFDGSRMTTSFPRTATVAKDVRSWVDAEAKQNTPYNLKIILTPLPNRNIEAGEEDQTLSDLGIVGSATMVMVPVKGFVDSYAGGNGPGILSSVTNAAGSVIGGVASFLGLGAVTRPQRTAESAAGENAATTVDDAATTSQSSVKVRTLADQRAEERLKKSNELYNGNQLNFQGKKDDTQKDD